MRTGTGYSKNIQQYDDVVYGIALGRFYGRMRTGIMEEQSGGGGGGGGGGTPGTPIVDLGLAAPFGTFWG